MTPSRILLSLALLIGFYGNSLAQNGCARLSWGTCDSWQSNDCWQGPGIYRLVESIHGVGAPIIGSDSEINVQAIIRQQHCNEGIPDAWRFGSGECQGTDRIAISRLAQTGCPTLGVENALVLTDVYLDLAGNLNIRLAETHDAFTPDPNLWYTDWVVAFDFAHSNAGATPTDGSTCGYVDQPANLAFNFATVITASQQSINLAACETLPSANSSSATWNGGWGICDESSSSSPRTSPCGPVPTQATTWGRVKSMYH